jgi:hypothetical protein
MPRRTPTRRLNKLLPLQSAIVSFLFVSASSFASAQSPVATEQTPKTAQPNPNTEQQDYCVYLTEQAQAQGDLLRTPAGLAAFTQPDTGLPTQVVAGATLSLSSVKKAGITLDVARKNCNLYTATIGVQQYLQYALPAIERSALANRLDLIGRASKSLEDLIADTTKMVEAQNMTRPMLLELQMTKIKLEADRADTQSKIAAIYVPPLATEPLKAQVADKQANDLTEQKATEKLARQNNWDVALTVGVHQQVNPFANSPEAYGEVTATYNFASHAIDKHLDRSTEAYAGWKKVQESDVTRGMEVLREQVIDNIAAQQRRLDALQHEGQQIEKSLQMVTSPDTTAAYDFRNQLTTTQLLLGIETGDSSFRLERLQEFLNRNY